MQYDLDYIFLKKKPVLARRLKLLQKTNIPAGPVVYWMQRDQRSVDNWALLIAHHMAAEKGRPLVVVFCLVDNFLGAQKRQYDFMIQGLIQVQESLNQMHIPFVLLQGRPEQEITGFLKTIQASDMVTDMNPLRIAQQWKNEIQKQCLCSLYEVDAHNIVPVWQASPKQEFAAYTIRLKMKKILRDFFTDFPSLQKMRRRKKPFIEAEDNFFANLSLVKKNQPFGSGYIFGSDSPDISQASNKSITSSQKIWQDMSTRIPVSFEAGPIQWLKAGQKNASRHCLHFMQKKYTDYENHKNDPNAHAVSHLSPFLHFGHISSQRIALDLMHQYGEEAMESAFFEELFVRKELADNFCYYNSNYDQFSGFPDWAKKTLQEHWNDARQYIYSQEQWEKAQTHDPLWNASQNQLLQTGLIHGYMRMYWAKKILEWSENPSQALQSAIYLNDKYALDGRDPNGYTGIAWSIGGVHDRAWPQRQVFGKVRYMNFNGAQRKFNVKQYMQTWNNDQKNSLF